MNKKTIIVLLIAFVLGILFAHLGIVWLSMCISFSCSTIYNVIVHPKFRFWKDELFALLGSLISWIALLI